MTTPADATGSGEVERATTLELFLDLVFVFTVTQLTGLVSHPTGLADYGKAALILGVTWWMYDGFVWLTGNLSMARPGYRMGVFAGMAGFLLMALAIPGVFGATAASADNALVFGLAYLGSPRCTPGSSPLRRTRRRRPSGGSRRSTSAPRRWSSSPRSSLSTGDGSAGWAHWRWSPRPRCSVAPTAGR